MGEGAWGQLDSLLWNKPVCRSQGTIPGLEIPTFSWSLPAAPEHEYFGPVSADWLYLGSIRTMQRGSGFPDPRATRDLEQLPSARAFCRREKEPAVATRKTRKALPPRAVTCTTKTEVMLFPMASRPTTNSQGLIYYLQGRASVSH